MSGHFVKNFWEHAIERIPDIKSVLGVFGVIVMVIYSRMLFVSFLKLPSWLYYLTLSQILSVYAYGFLSSFIDSLMLLFGILVIDYLVFFRLRDPAELQTRMVTISLAVMACFILRLYFYGGLEDNPAFLEGETVWWVSSFIIGFLLAFMGSKVESARKLLDIVAEKTSIFLFIYIPLSILSILIVLMRLVLS